MGSKGQEADSQSSVGSRRLGVHITHDNLICKDHSSRNWGLSGIFVSGSEETGGCLGGPGEQSAVSRSRGVRELIV